MRHVDDPVVCLCGRVTERELLDAWQQGCTDLCSLQEHTGAATGCGDCRPDIEDLLGMSA